LLCKEFVELHGETSA